MTHYVWMNSCTELLYRSNTMDLYALYLWLLNIFPRNLVQNEFWSPWRWIGKQPLVSWWRIPYRTFHSAASPVIAEVSISSSWCFWSHTTNMSQLSTFFHRLLHAWLQKWTGISVGSVVCHCAAPSSKLLGTVLNFVLWAGTRWAALTTAGPADVEAS